jgi:hypothetical protein
MFMEMYGTRVVYAYEEYVSLYETWEIPMNAKSQEIQVD